MAPRADRQPVITGLGVALPLGLCDSRAFYGALGTGPKPPAGEAFVRMPTWDVDDVVDSRQTRRMSPLSKLALAACHRALEDAGLDEVPAGRSALTFASRYGSTDFLHDFHTGLLAHGTGSPFLFTNGVANAPAGHISLEYGIRGPCFTLMGGASSAVAALQDAAARLGDGLSDVVLVGAAEELTDFFASVMERMRGSGRAPAPPPGEGGVFLVVETAARARERNRQAYGSLGALACEWTGPADAGERLQALVAGALPPQGPWVHSASVWHGGPGPDDVRVLQGVLGDKTARTLAVRDALGEAHGVTFLAQIAAGCLALSEGVGKAAGSVATLLTEDGQAGVVVLERWEG